MGPEVEADDVDSLKIYTAGIPAEYGRKMGGVVEVNTLDANTFRRDMNNYSDDDAILNSTIGFPIAFRKAVLYGAEAKLEVLHWGRFSGFGSYSWIVGNCWLPVVGGLLLGSENGVAVGPTGALINTQLTGRLPDSQDQRNTVPGRVRYQVAPRLWIAVGADYNSGLPFEADLSPQQYALQYGQVMVNHLNFNLGRIHPYFTQNASVGADLLPAGKAFGALAGRRFEPEQYARSNRLRRLILRQRNRSGTAVHLPPCYVVLEAGAFYRARMPNIVL
jgi:hypothetical protein